MKVLIVAPSLPVPATAGGALRILNLMRALSREHELDLLTHRFEPSDEAHTAELEDCCREVHLAPWRRTPMLVQAGRTAIDVFRGIPFQTKYVNTTGMRALLREVSRQGRYDIIQFEHSHLASLLSALHPTHGTRTILATHNVMFRQFERMYRQERDPIHRCKLLLTWLPMRRWEPRMAARFDHVLTVSDDDRALLLACDASLAVSVVPNGVDTRTQRPIPRAGRERNLLLVGSMDYKPNAESALWFSRAIFPKIRERIRDCTLTIVGKDPPPVVLALEDQEGIHVAPNVPDVRPYHEKALVSVAALQSGGGTRLKILEAMANGTPVVTTSLGCEGIHGRHGEHFLVADKPDTFAGEVCKLIEDKTLWQHVSDAARQLVEREYDWNSIGALLSKVYVKVAGNR